MKISCLFLIALMVTSCERIFLKEAQKFQGNWQMQRVSYLDGKQVIAKDGNLGQIFFGAGKTAPNDGSYIGKQTVGKWEAEFQYSGIITSNTIDISLLGADRKSIPSDAIGKVQVYQYEFIDNNTLRIYTDKEYDYSSNKLMTDVSYVLKR